MGDEEECLGLLTELLGSGVAQQLAPRGLVGALEVDPEELIRSGGAAESARLLGIVGRLARAYADALMASLSEVGVDELVLDLRRTGLAVYDWIDADE